MAEMCQQIDAKLQQWGLCAGCLASLQALPSLQAHLAHVTEAQHA